MKHTARRLSLLLLLSCCSKPIPGWDTEGDDHGLVSLQPITYTEWLDQLEGFKGKIVVVDFWATWCGPCLERFPKLVEFHDSYSGQNVQFVSICLDDPSDIDAVETAELFLQQNQATFTNYLMDENALDAFEKFDLLGIPAVFVYDRSGILQFRLTGDDPRNQFTEADVERAILELMER